MMMTKEMMRNEEKGWRSVGLKEEEEARERWNLTEKGKWTNKDPDENRFKRFSLEIEKRTYQ